MKIGVQNTDGKSDRLAIHKRRGWSEVKHWEVPTAAIARAVELAVLRAWAGKGARFAAPEDVPAGDGASESVFIGRVDVPDTTRLVEKTLRAELGISRTRKPGSTDAKPS